MDIFKNYFEEIQQCNKVLYCELGRSLNEYKRCFCGGNIRYSNDLHIKFHIDEKPVHVKAHGAVRAGCSAMFISKGEFLRYKKSIKYKQVK